MEHLKQHLVAPDRTAYRARQLTARETRRVDQHLAACATCRAEFLADVRVGAVAQHTSTNEWARARAVLAPVQRERDHLSYEQLETYSDDKLTAAGRVSVERHVAQCARCAGELTEMRRFAPVLAATIPAAAPSSPWIARIVRWVGVEAVGGGVAVRGALAVLVAALALSIVIESTTRSTAPAIEFSLRRDAVDMPVQSAAPAAGEFDQRVFAEIGAAAPGLAAAFRSGDLATVADQLKLRAAGGDARAQTALALLYLAGEGVERDLGQAERLLRQAAGQGDTAAAHNLQLLVERGLVIEKR